jgi:hypothetical protein
VSDTDFASLIVPVATHPDIWGDPNPRFKKRNELRWGRHGGRMVVLDKGVWQDHETGEAGGVLALVMRERNCDKEQALEWLTSARLLNGDARENERIRTAKPQARAVPQLEAEYAYVDERGTPISFNCRYKLPPPECKTFRQRKANGEWNMKGARVVPYRLPDIIEAIKRDETIYICEGEKDVENAFELLGVVATTNAAGAGKWTEEHSKFLKGADVVWLPDNDDAGRGHVAKGAPTLRKYAKRQRVLHLPELDEKQDLTDWLHQSPDNNRARFDNLVAKRAREWSPEPPDSKFGAVMWEHLDDVPDESEWIVDDFFTAGDVSAIVGRSQSGKSFLAIHVGMLVACASMPELPPLDFFSRKVAGGLVIYQAGEGARGIFKRLRAWRQEYGIAPKLHLPFVLLRNRVDLFRDKDITPLIAEIKAWQAYYDKPLKMLFIDTLATAIAGAEENSAKDMTIVLANCARIRNECGCHVCLVHHLNAVGDKMRGSTALPANLDQAISVIREPGKRTRKVELAKQRDDSDEVTLQFDLKSIEIGKRGDNRPITSCVCVEPSDDDEPASSPGARLPGAQYRFFGSLIDALKAYGEAPPADIGVPDGVRAVVPFGRFRELYGARLWHHEGEPDDKVADRVRKAIERAGAPLLQAGIVGRHVERGRNYIWWTGQAVQGFRRTPIDPKPPEPDAPSEMLDDAWSEFFP